MRARRIFNTARVSTTCRPTSELLSMGDVALTVKNEDGGKRVVEKDPSVMTSSDAMENFKIQLSIYEEIRGDIGAIGDLVRKLDALQQDHEKAVDTDEMHKLEDAATIHASAAQAFA